MAQCFLLSEKRENKTKKIICSIEPASNKYETMKSMIENGMNVARINFSHATEKDLIVLAGGFPNNTPVKSTNFLKIEKI